jgi:hypothetical protein
MGGGGAAEAEVAGLLMESAAATASASAALFGTVAAMSASVASVAAESCSCKRTQAHLLPVRCQTESDPVSCVKLLGERGEGERVDAGAPSRAAAVGRHGRDLSPAPDATPVPAATPLTFLPLSASSPSSRHGLWIQVQTLVGYRRRGGRVGGGLVRSVVLRRGS